MLTRREFVMRTGLAGGAVFSGMASWGYGAGKKAARPNILWITCEDLSCLLGCYGDKLARTPNLDKLAAEGVMYTNAYSNAPVCSPARCTIITGMYAASLGTSHMRSQRPLPNYVKGFPEYLRQAGYYTTNRSKTDYNNSSLDVNDLWNGCSGKATFEDRPKADQPFFSIFNFTQTHESKLQKVMDHAGEYRVAGSEVTIPPYLPDTEIIRQTLAKHYDLIETVDRLAGEVLKRLEEDGQLDNTIIFFYGDHGGVYPRTKRYLFQSGTKVPMIIKFPKNYQHLAPTARGGKCDRLICFADLAPTVLSLVGIEPPSYMQGKAFLGKYDREEHEYLYHYADRFDSRYRMVRMICDKKYLYIRNFTPFRSRNEFSSYYFRSEAVRSWCREYAAGRCNADQSRDFGWRDPEELYVIEDDPWQLHNVAGDKRYEPVRTKMAARLYDMMWTNRDVQIIPEVDMIERSKGSTPYEMIRSSDLNYQGILTAAFTASKSASESYKELVRYLDDADSAIRYWAVVGLINLKEKGAGAKAKLLERLEADSSCCVRYMAADALWRLGMDPEKLVPRLIEEGEQVMKHLNGDQEIFQMVMLTDVLDNHWEQCRPWLTTLEAWKAKVYGKKQFDYIHRNLEYAVESIRSNGEWAIRP